MTTLNQRKQSCFPAELRRKVDRLAVEAGEIGVVGLAFS